MIRLERVLPILLACLVSGCGPAVLVDAPAQWPHQIGSRRLFATPNAYIYASNPSAAAEADRLAAQTARDFQKNTGRAAPKLTIFVNDAGDKLPCEPHEYFLALKEPDEAPANRSATVPSSMPMASPEATSKASPDVILPVSQPATSQFATSEPASSRPATTQQTTQASDSPPIHSSATSGSTNPTTAATSPSSAPADQTVSTMTASAAATVEAMPANDLDAEWQSLLKQASDGGVEPSQLLVSQPGGTIKRANMIRYLHVAPKEAEQVDTLIIYTSNAAMMDFFHKAYWASPQMALPAKIALAPMMAAMEPKVAEMMSGMQATVLYAAYVAQQDDWSSDKKADMCRQYMSLKMPGGG